MTLARKLFGFEGRLRRQDWWMLVLSLALGQLVVGELLICLWLGQERSLFGGGVAARWADQPALAIMGAVAVAALWPRTALAAKRAHDRDRGAAIVVVAVLAADILSLASPMLTAPSWPAATVGGLAALGLVSWLLVNLGCLEGTRGPNRFGPSPKTASHQVSVG